MRNFNEKFKIKDYLIYETRYWVWSLRPNHPIIGSSILSLKRSESSFSNLSVAEFSDLKCVITVIEETLKSLIKYDKINYLMLMMVDNQIHFHVFPRFEDNVIWNNMKWSDTTWPKPPLLDGEEISVSIAEKLIKDLRKELVKLKEVNENEKI